MSKQADGEYTGLLFRKNVVKFRWEEVNGAPMIACKVESGKANLTVERIVYGKEHKLIQRLLQIHVELGQLQPQYMACLNSTNILVPTPVTSLVNEVAQIVETLHTDYNPGYLPYTVYIDVINVLKQIVSSIENSYDLYARTPSADDYTTEIGSDIGGTQIAIQTVLGPLNIDGIIK